MKRILIKETINHEINQPVRVSGWVDNWRAHGKVLFIDLRDSSGLLQIVFSSENNELYETAKELRPEWVISVQGKVKERPRGMINPKINTGKIELEAEKLEIFSKAETLPFNINDNGYEINEEQRLKYRYLDLRRPRMKKNITQRNEIIYFIR